MNFCCLNPGEVSVGPASMAGLGAAGRSGIATKGADGEFWSTFTGDSPGGFFPSAGLSSPQEVRNSGRPDSANPRVHELRRIIARCIIPVEDRIKGSEVHKTRKRKERQGAFGKLLQCVRKCPEMGDRCPALDPMRRCR